MPHMSLRHSCSVSPAAHCHLRGSLCPDLAQPYPTPRRLWGGDRGMDLVFWRSSQRQESSRSGLAAFQVIEGPGGLLAPTMLGCRQVQVFPQ